MNRPGANGNRAVNGECGWFGGNGVFLLAAS